MMRPHRRRAVLQPGLAATALLIVATGSTLTRVLGEGLALGRPGVLLLLPLSLLPLLIRPRPVEVSPAPWSWSGEPWAGRPARMSWAGVPVLTALGTAVLLVAASRPVLQHEGAPLPGAGAAVMVVLDVSASMTEGVDPPLARARSAVRALAETRAEVRLGLVTFAGTALTRLPPATDPGLLAQALATADAGVPDQGTALGTALGIAAQRLAEEEANARVILLLTDGRSNTGAVDPVTAARLARTLGVRVHAVELGSDDPSGASLLREVAREGGGRLLAPGAGAASLLDALQEVTPVPGVERPLVQQAAWPPLILLGVALLGAARLIRLVIPAPEAW